MNTVRLSFHLQCVIASSRNNSGEAEDVKKFTLSYRLSAIDVVGTKVGGGGGGGSSFTKNLKICVYSLCPTHGEDFDIAENHLFRSLKNLELTRNPEGKELIWLLQLYF